MRSIRGIVGRRRRLVVLAAVTLVVPSTVLGLIGMFADHRVEPVGVGWGVTAWLVAHYLALAALCLWAARTGLSSFATAVELTTAVITVQSVALSLVTSTSDQDMAAVGVLFSPVLYLGAAAVLAVVGLVRHLTRAAGAPGSEPLAEVSPAGRS